MVVLITGASSGIGAATAQAFALSGARLILAARRIDRLRSLTSTLPSECHLIQLDVRDRAAVHQAVAAIPQPFSAIDVLVNNAGLSRGFEPLHEGSEEDWDEMIDTNIKGLLYVTRAVLPGMVARGHGHIVNVGSIAGHEPYPRGNVYCASKAAVRMLNKTMRLDLHGTGIRVTTVDPGLVPTEFSEVRFHGDRTRAASVYENTRPLSAMDVADTIVWCTSRPPWVNVEELLLMPTDQAAPAMVYRRPLPDAGAGASAPLAQRWFDAWNAHDAEAVLALYAPEARHTSPHVRASGGATDTLKGRDAIGAYFRRALQKDPSLRFEPVSLSSGLRTVVIEYRAHRDGIVESNAELLELDADGLIAHSRVYHAH
ncbi:MAG: SDR family NAD(P)-dependent oxidoreductase [Deltaproteobacteria bacterium]|nr:SDR family NAD(P)-dependent oxidoreductase [Deltaproteobacteria bacterium]MBI3386155.1 SDR family NAD(P)-dependent oxidoreductase [Deltaproteobacteria bacterium]